MYRLIVTELAFAELEEAISYYKSKVPNLGYEFEEEVLCILDVIKHNPLLFPVKFEYIYETVVK